MGFLLPLNSPRIEEFLNGKDINVAGML